jgi:hypothetical protein
MPTVVDRLEFHLLRVPEKINVNLPRTHTVKISHFKI